MLSIKERQKRLAYLGYYTGKIDGIEGKGTKKAYKLLQDDYFIRAKDKDGLYGNNTEILLMNAYNVKLICRNFKLEEFKCHCKGKYCTGYPAILDSIFLANLQIFRNKIGVAMNVTSGLRCKKHNAEVTTSTKSRHLTGKALDFYSSKNKTLEGRKALINKWINDFKESRYGYCNGYYNNQGTTGKKTSSTMGSAIHIDVK